MMCLPCTLQVLMDGARQSTGSSVVSSAEDVEAVGVARTQAAHLDHLQRLEAIWRDSPSEWVMAALHCTHCC